MIDLTLVFLFFEKKVRTPLKIMSDETENRLEGIVSTLSETMFIFKCYIQFH